METEQGTSIVVITHKTPLHAPYVLCRSDTKVQSREVSTHRDSGHSKGWQTLRRDQGNDGQVTTQFQGVFATPEFINDISQGITRIMPQRYNPHRGGRCDFVVVKKGDDSTSKDKGEEQEEVEQQEGTIWQKQDNSFVVVTYNVWFADLYWEERAKAMFGILKHSNADAICLQEVTPRFLELLKQQQWLQDSYYLSDSSGNSVSAPLKPFCA